MGISAGKYIVDVISTKYIYPRQVLRLAESGNILVTEGNSRMNLKSWQLRPFAAIQYGTATNKPGIFSIFTNPIILILFGLLSLTWGLPKLMNYMDPDAMKDMASSMGDSSNPLEMMKNMLAEPNAAASSSSSGVSLPRPTLSATAAAQQRRRQELGSYERRE